MEILQRQSIKSTIYTYVGVIVGFVYTGILMPNFLTQSEIGALNLILAYSLIFAQLGSMGFNNTTVRVFPYFKDRASSHHGFLTLSIIVSAAGFIIVAIIYYFIKPSLVSRNIENSPIFANYLYLVLPVTLFTIVFNQFDAYARALYYSTTGTFLKEFFQRVLILLVVLMVVANLLNQNGLFIAYSVALSIPSVFIVAFLIFKKEFHISVNFRFLNKRLVKDMIRMCIFGVLTGFGVLAIAQIDRLMINHYMSESQTGIYTVAFYFGVLIMMPSRAVQRIAGSIIATAFIENDMKTIDKMYSQTCLYQFMLALFLLLLLWLNIDEIFTIIPPAYMSGKSVVFFIGMASVIIMAGGTSVSIISASRYYSFSAWFVGVYLVLIVVTNIFFIPTFGIAGAAIASAISTLFYTLLQFVFIYRKWRLQPYNYRYLLLMAVAVIVYFIVMLLPLTDHYLIDITIKSISVVILFTALVYFLQISKDLNLWMEDFILSSIKRK